MATVTCHAQLVNVALVAPFFLSLSQPSKPPDLCQRAIVSSLSLSPVLATIKSLVFSHTKLFNLECKEEEKNTLWWCCSRNRNQICNLFLTSAGLGWEWRR